MKIFWKLTDQSTHVAMVLKDDADRTLRLFTTHEHLRTVIGNSAQRSKGGPVFKVKSAQVSTEAGETVVDAELIDAGGGGDKYRELAVSSKSNIWERFAWVLSNYGSL